MNTESLIDGGYNEIKKCRYGYMCYNCNDQYIGRSLQLYGEFSEGEAMLFKQIIKPGQTVLDVGANIGAHTVLMGLLVGDLGQVHAFEPQRIVFQTLSANIAINSHNNIFCYNSAVGSDLGEVDVPKLNYNSENNYGGVSLESTDIFIEKETVKQVTIDSLELKCCDFLKIDVEGMELMVLNGARQTLTKFKPLLYVENDRREKSNALITFIIDAGYDLFWHTPTYFMKNNYFSNYNNVFGETISINMLCVPRNSNYNIQGYRKVDGSDDWWDAS